MTRESGPKDQLKEVLRAGHVHGYTIFGGKLIDEVLAQMSSNERPVQAGSCHRATINGRATASIGSTKTGQGPTLLLTNERLVVIDPDMAGKKAGRATVQAFNSMNITEITEISHNDERDCTLRDSSGQVFVITNSGHPKLNPVLYRRGDEFIDSLRTLVATARPQNETN